MAFEHVWTVRFSDTDPFGIAHYPRIVEAVHGASDAFMQEIGFPYWEITRDHGFGLPLVAMDAEFESPLEAGDDVTIRLTPDPGTRSVRFEYEGYVGDELAFTVEEQRVCANQGGDGSRELPPGLRGALETYAAD